ncbi:MAG: hypothetical protein MUF19_04285 [Candidatus Pacebacteria bacterium]|jgi:hypothetical protein|nr:hypothetical protein [Candidatus Paceibacterota bacterium]
MEISLFVTYVFGTLFWVLVFAEMALATYVFCYFNLEYDKGVMRDGVAVTNQSLWIAGLLSMGVPVLQVGLWLHGPSTLGWVLVLLVLAFWIYTIVTSLIDSKRG